MKKLFVVRNLLDANRFRKKLSDVNVLEIVNRNKIQFETGGEAVEAALNDK